MADARCLRLGVLLLGLLAAAGHTGPARAETGVRLPMYDVEVIVFRDRSPQAAGERWPTRGAAGNTGGGGGPRPVEAGLENLPAGQRALRNIADALQRSGAYEVLVHAAWRQAGLDRRMAQPWRVPANAAGGGTGLAGSIRLVRERFLHLEVDLRLARPGAGNFATGGAATPPAVFELRETRRVRRGELHYFDHPWLGVIARVVAFNPPPAAAPGETGPPDANAGETAPPAAGAAAQ